MYTDICVCAQYVQIYRCINIHVYIYIYMYIHINTHITDITKWEAGILHGGGVQYFWHGYYIYIYEYVHMCRERERKIEGEGEGERKDR